MTQEHGANTMQAAQIIEFGKPYKLSNVPIPELPEEGLLVKVHAAGFCHSDLQVFEGQFAADLPMIPSHEPAGEIVAVGGKVEGQWKVGDRVGVLNYKHACGICPGCKQTIRRTSKTDPRFCEKRKMAGFKHDGCFAEYMVADPATTVKLPATVSFEQGAPLMCAGATAWGALQKLLPMVKAGDPVAIVGIGGVGHLCLQFAKAMGFRVVAVDTRDAGRILATEMPSELKPDLIVDPMSSSVKQQLYDFTAGEGLAGAVVCTDSHQGTMWTYEQLGIGGVIVPLGLPRDHWQFDSSLMVFKELVIRGSYVASTYQVQQMLECVGKHKIESQVTVVNFDDIPGIVDKYLQQSMKGRLVVRI
ncbi:alcohol dehydrogenase GroES-like domain-containing protein [Elsinoe ampelina]|uniref:Alcohol dehydrogenase GroES-like domain-containing protein n=1 Tax=Elsinoe ampelina TaxID=302913 RepID=A0A6A6G995_9PEZI|nr:alcohol dehydrogenase GroES-like domain-containing protein [Elsinoe ampelina]